MLYIYRVQIEEIPENYAELDPDERLQACLDGRVKKTGAWEPLEPADVDEQFSEESEND